MIKLTSKAIRENVTGVDSLSSKNGVFTLRRGYFYTGGNTAEHFAAAVKAQLRAAGIEAVVLDCGSVWKAFRGCGSVWKAFRGGASVANQSHWWAKIAQNGATHHRQDKPSDA